MIEDAPPAGLARTQREKEWALRRVQDIRVAMSGRHESGFIDVVDDILAKGMDE